MFNRIFHFHFSDVNSAVNALDGLDLSKCRKEEFLREFAIIRALKQLQSDCTPTPVSC